MKALTKFSTGERALICYAIFFLIFLYIPVLFLPLFSFSESQYMTFPITDWTLERYMTMWQKTKLRDALYASIKVGIFASVISTILGILVARAMTRYIFPLKGLVMGFTILPMVFPEIIMGVGLLIFAVVFAVNSSLHSYLIVSYAGRDGVSLDVGFYYMANAIGRLIGTILSGWLFQQYG